MGLKLTFKGDKKKSKNTKKFKSNELKKSLEKDINKNTIKQHKTIRINGKDFKLDDIDLNKLESGWTNLNLIDLQKATPSILNKENGKLPIIITYSNNDENNLCLEKIKYLSNDDNQVKNKLKFNKEFEVSDINNTINFTNDNENLIINRIEPKNVNQVFILSDITSIFKFTNKFIEKEGNEKYTFYSIKTTDGEYLTFDPINNEIKLTKTLTELGIFNLILEKSQVDNNEMDNNITQPLLKCRFVIGNKTDYNTMIITKGNEIKIIPDPEDLLKPMSRFNIRIRLNDSFKSMELKKEKKDIESNNKNTNIIDNKISEKVIELSKLGLKINDKIIKDMSKAYKEGYLNQWILDFKEKNVHDRRV